MTQNNYLSASKAAYHLATVTTLGIWAPQLIVLLMVAFDNKEAKPGVDVTANIMRRLGWRLMLSTVPAVSAIVGFACKKMGARKKMRVLETIRKQPEEETRTPGPQLDK